MFLCVLKICNNGLSFRLSYIRQAIYMLESVGKTLTSILLVEKLVTSKEIAQSFKNKGGKIKITDWKRLNASMNSRSFSYYAGVNFYDFLSD